MRKQRTHQHVIADLGFNYTERQVLKAGFILNRLFPDYGYDGSMVTFDINGELEPGNVFIQVKATDKIKLSKKHNAIEFSLSKKDLETWILEPSIVILVLYDAIKEKSFYIDIQKYFVDKHLNIDKINKFLQVFLDLKDEFNPESVKYLRSQKNQQLWT